MTGLLAVAAAHHRELREAIRHRELVPAVRAAVPRIVPLVRQVLALFGITLPSRPAVSVITPTWQRHDLLTGRCIPSVRDQLYGGTVEHVIVSDGPDESLAARVPGVAFLPDHQLARNRGVRARAHGTALASHGISFRAERVHGSHGSRDSLALPAQGPPEASHPIYIGCKRGG